MTFEKHSDRSIEEWKATLLERFNKLHNNYSNEIPEEMIDGSKRENHIYKVRGNWFDGVMSTLELAESHNLFTQEFNEEWKSFFRKYIERMKEGSERPRTTKEEIDIADRLLIKAQVIISNSK